MAKEETSSHNKFSTPGNYEQKDKAVLQVFFIVCLYIVYALQL
jgi:hypothetical protein